MEGSQRPYRCRQHRYGITHKRTCKPRRGIAHLSFSCGQNNGRERARQMETIVIDKTKQEFNGERFYFCGNYFQHNGRRLHRIVWEYHNGPIPDGYHVHHKDENRCNNSIENLELMPAHDHLSHHSSDDGNKARLRALADYARPLAEAWHHTPEATEVAKRMAAQVWAKAKYKEYTCEACGKKFTSRAMQGAKYCGGNCKARALRKRRRLEKCQRLSQLSV